MIPLFFNLAGKRALVVGGGPVGRRKARALAEGGAHIRLVCLEPRHEEAIDWDWLTEPYRDEHMEGAAIAVAAATALVNRRVAADGRSRHLPVNVADDPAASDFFIPSTLRRGELTVAIGTNGAAPGLARSLRLMLEQQFDDAFAQWVAILAELRPLIRRHIAAMETRRELHERFCQSAWLERLRHEGPAVVRAAMLAELSPLVEPPKAPL